VHLQVTSQRCTYNGEQDVRLVLSASPSVTFLRITESSSLRIAGLPAGAEVVGFVLQIFAEALRAGVAGLAVAADALG
jgi:hypothetical protein